MTNKYREYAMDPVDMQALVYLRDLNLPAISFEMLLAGVAADSHDEYHEWVKRWKQNYNIIADTIRINRLRTDIGQPDIHRIHNALRRLANTMLNARQFARDRRRNYTK